MFTLYPVYIRLCNAKYDLKSSKYNFKYVFFLNLTVIYNFETDLSAFAASHHLIAKGLSCQAGNNIAGTDLADRTDGLLGVHTDVGSHHHIVEA